MTSLNIQVEDQQGKKILRIEGRIDATTTPILEKYVSDLFHQKQKWILMDFGKVDYLSSAGMRLMLSTTKKCKGLDGKLGFCNMNEDVMEIIKMAGFERILNIYSTEKEALEALGSP
jgi:anti-anti-sigma factor